MGLRAEAGMDLVVGNTRVNACRVALEAEFEAIPIHKMNQPQGQSHTKANALTVA